MEPSSDNDDNPQQCGETDAVSKSLLRGCRAVMPWRICIMAWCENAERAWLVLTLTFLTLVM